MRRLPRRVLLPIVFGVLALVLFVWEYENDRVVESMGMAWDTGPPMWPYVAVPLVSYAINAPAYIVCWPILKLLSPGALWVQYVVWFPAIVMLWWWVGTRMDFGLLGRRRYSSTRLLTAVLVVGALALLALSVRLALGEYRLFQNYWPPNPPIYALLLLRAIGPIAWCLCLAAVFVRSAIRLKTHRPL